jgi:Tfp pilus assembly protein PilX
MWRNRRLADVPTRRPRQSVLSEAFGRAAAGDDGVGLILVLGYAVVITLVITVSFATVSSTTRSGNSHVQYGQAVDAAEAGVDQALARLQYNNAYSTAGADVPPAWVDGFPSSATERTWALQTANTLLGPSSTGLQKTAQGEYFAMRPSNVHTVYSIGWEPSRAKAVRVRVLRNDYLFGSYQPDFAILARGSVDISGSFSVATIDSSEPPDVHSEGTVNCNASFKPPNGTKINGVTGGTCGSVGSSVTVPDPNPRYVYNSQSARYSSQWFDLCPDGTMHSPGPIPCTGTLLSGTRNWAKTLVNGVVTWKTSVPQAGIYYIYGGDAAVDAGPHDSATVSVLAEPSNGTSCPAQGGSISVRQLAILPAYPNLGLLAGGDASLSTESSVGDDAHPATVTARGKIDFNTSSAVGVTGAVIAGNVCPGSGPNTFQGSSVRFVPGMALPLQDVVRSTLQTELN